MSVRVAAVSGRPGVHAFAQAARAARAGDALWSEPLAPENKLLFDAAKSPFTRHNPHAYLVASADGQPVGRIFVSEDRDHLARHQDGAAHFGFLDAVDDPAVVRALMAAAAEWARGRGLTRLEGPYNPSVNHQIGLLTAGDGRPATYKTDDSPPRYAEALRALGFTLVRELVAYEADIAVSDYPARVDAVLARWRGRPRLALKPFSLLRFGNSVREQGAVYDDAWADNWHAVPPSEEEARFIARFMLLSVPSGWLYTATWDGQPIGVLQMIPDLNEAARGIAGHEWPLGFARYAWRLHISKVKRVRVATIGVIRAFRGTKAGAMADALMMAEAVRKARRAGAAQLEISWILGDNRRMIATAERLPARRTKTWGMFGKVL